MRRRIAAAAVAAAVLIATQEVRAEVDDDGRLLPTLSAAIGQQGESPAGHGWLGVAYMPSDAALTWFFAAGGEIDVRPYRSETESFTTVVFGPQARLGMSWFPDANKYLSAVNVYGLVGYRGPSVFNEGAVRIGVGASSPLVGVAALSAQLILPWMVEGSVDLIPNGYQLAWRLGVAY